MSATAELALVSETVLTEEQARQFLDAFRHGSQQRPSIRKLAETWGWHRSKVERFLSRVDAETAAASPAQTGETPAETRSHGQPFARPGPSGDDTWIQEAIESGSVLIHEQPLTAVYFNNADQVVIRQKGDPFEEDAIVLIAPEFLDRFITRLKQCRDKGE